MINYRIGDLFEANADAFAHGCNTQGKMNSGIAKEFRRYFPEMYKNYRERCRKKLFLPGKGYIFYNKQKPHIINLATQEYSKADIDLVESAFKWMHETLPLTEIAKIAMPKIASGLGGLEWNLVREILEKYFKRTQLTIDVWSLK